METYLSIFQCQMSKKTLLTGKILLDTVKISKFEHEL